MAITVQHLGPSGTPFFSSQGRFRECLCDLLLDNSYPANGYSVPQTSAASFGMSFISHMDIGGSVNGGAGAGLLTQWDRTNSKVLVLPVEPPNALIIEESVTLTANAGRLANVPAYIIACEARTGSTTGAFTIVPTGSVLATTQCAVDFTTGNIATFGTDAVTNIRMTYIPMGNGPFTPANQVIDEVVALPNGSTVNTASQAVLVQYVYESTTLKIALPIIGTQNSPAAGQVQVQLDNSGATTITDNAAQNGKSAKVTYWKMSGFVKGVFGFVDRTSTNASSNVINYASALAAGDLDGFLLNCYGVHHAALATNSDVPSVAGGPTFTAAASSPSINPASNRITYFSGDSITREFIAYILLNSFVMGNYSGGTRPQVPTGTNLSGSTVRARVVGF